MTKEITADYESLKRMLNGMTDYQILTLELNSDEKISDATEDESNESI